MQIFNLELYSVPTLEFNIFSYILFIRPTAKYIMEELQRLIKLQYAYDPSSLYLTASRRSNISRKSEPQEGKVTM